MTNYFEILDIPAKLKINSAVLEQVFYSKQKGLGNSIITYDERKATLNKAYKILKNPILRLEYILVQNEILDLQNTSSHQFPQDLLMKYFDFQEMVEEAEALAELLRLKAEVRNNIESIIDGCVAIEESEPEKNNILKHFKASYFEIKFLQSIQKSIEIKIEAHEEII